jgi:hypothetical protein
MDKNQTKNTYVPLDNDGNIQVVDIGLMTHKMNDKFHNTVKNQKL